MDIFLFSDIMPGMAIGLQQDLAAIDKKETINLFVNSSGGSVTEGIAMMQLLNKAPNTVNSHIMGLAASMASALALGVNGKVSMADGSILMIHNASFAQGGTAKQMTENAALAESLSNSIASIYMAKTGLGRRVIKDLMDKESKFTAKEALKNGFVDEVTQPMAIAAKFDINLKDMNLKEQITNLGKAIMGTDETPEADKAEKEALNQIAENIKKADSPADAITAELVKNEDYLPFVNLNEQFREKVTEFINEQKSPDEMLEEFRAIVKDELKELLKGIKSKAVVPVGATFEKTDNSPLDAQIPQMRDTDMHKAMQSAIDKKFNNN